MLFSKKNESVPPISSVIGHDLSLRKGAMFFACSLLVVLLLWQWASYEGLTSPLMANPVEIYEDTLNLFTRGDLGAHVLASTRRVVVGLLFGTMIGFPIGIALSLFPLSRLYGLIVIPFLLTFSKISVLYIMIIVFGIGEEIKIGISIWTAFIYQLALAFHGAYECFSSKDIRTSDLMADTAMLGPTRWQLCRHILVPMLLPRLFLGLLIASPVAWLMLVLSEVVPRGLGIGGIISMANDMPSVSLIITATILLAILGIAMWSIIWAFQKYTLRW